MTERVRLLFLIGPTASGKSAVGIEAAGPLGAELLSLDSMAVYCGMDIGTDKPSPEDRERVPHHLIDICEPSESFSTGRYLAEAEKAIADVTARGRLPLFVGGTSLYLKAITEGLFSGPPADWQLRRKLHDEAELHGAAPLHERLRKIDPAYADRIHPNDLRRIVRALEVFEKTGRPISQQHTQFGKPHDRYDSRVVCIRRERAEICRRIDKRVGRMFERGLVEETRKLLALGMSREARQALGYRQVIEHIEGRISLEEAIELTRRKTRAFAKSQMTWFRSIPLVRWLDAARDEPVESLAEQALATFESG